MLTAAIAGLAMFVTASMGAGPARATEAGGSMLPVVVRGGEGTAALGGNAGMPSVMRGGDGMMGHAREGWGSTERIRWHDGTGARVDVVGFRSDGAHVAVVRGTGAEPFSREARRVAHQDVLVVRGHGFPVRHTSVAFNEFGGVFGSPFIFTPVRAFGQSKGFGHHRFRHHAAR